MDTKKLLPKIAILGLAGAAIYFLKKKINTLQKDIDRTSSDLMEYQMEQSYESTPPALKYLKVFPYVDFSEITGNEWTGIARFEINNTSSNYTFTITRLKANLSICGFISQFIPGFRNTAMRIQPGKSVTIAVTYQDKRWYAAGDTAAKNAIRDYLRSEGRYGEWNRCLVSDVELTLATSGYVSETTYSFKNCAGDVRLRKGAKIYWQNSGENAADWKETGDQTNPGFTDNWQSV